MDHKMVKKMKKRKDLDKLLGNTRKHFRKKSGHILLKTDSQSSNSSDDFEHLNHLSAIRYKKSRCSSFLLYASICLSICTLILCCVLFGVTFILRTHMNQLQSELNSVSLNTKEKANELQDVYSRLQTLQIYVHQLNLNMTQQLKLFQKIANRFNGMEKKFKKFDSYETLLGSLSNVPTQLQQIRSMNVKSDRSIKQLKNDFDHASHQIADAMSRINSMKDKSNAPGGGSTPAGASQKSSNIAEVELKEINKRLSLLQLNVSDLRQVVSTQEGERKPTSQPISRASTINRNNDNHSIVQRLEHVEIQLIEMNAQMDSLLNKSGQVMATVDKAPVSRSIEELRKEIRSNKNIINILKKSKGYSTAVDEVHHKNEPHHQPEGKDKNLASVVEHLNSTLMRLQERLPDVRMTLGFGVSSNATFSSKSPLGHGVILKRDEYYKLRSFWAKASNSFTLSVQSKQRVDVMEKKFKKLKKQVVAAVKNIQVLEAVGLKPTERSVNPNRPEMEINVPVPVYTTPRDPSAPTPDPHLRLPWVKTARDAEINFYRWNRNGDDALSGDELDPAALRGFMGPYTPTMESIMHFDVNNDHRLSREEVLCLFGFIPWPCTSKITIPSATPTPKGNSGTKENTEILPTKSTSIATQYEKNSKPATSTVAKSMMTSPSPQAESKLSSETTKPLPPSSTTQVPTTKEQNLTESVEKVPA